MAELIYQDLVRRGMKEAFPSAPTLNPEVGIIVMLDGEFRGYYNFVGMYACRRFVDAIVEDSKVVWEDDETIAFDVPAGRLQIRGSAYASWKNPPDAEGMMEAIMEHEDNRLEKQFVLPSPYPGMARAIRAGRIIRESAGEDSEKPTRRKRSEDDDSDAPVRQRAPRRHRERRPASDDGMVTVGMIADELDISAREARQRLRKLGEKKPGAGWEWPKDEAEKVKKRIAAFKK